MKRNRGLPFAAAVGAFVGLIGCASAPAPVAAPETVGTLTESATHVATAPVHATTDFGHAEIVDTGDEVAPDTTTTATLVVKPEPAAPVAATPAADETPDIAPKNAHGF